MTTSCPAPRPAASAPQRRILRGGLIKRIHVNRAIIQANRTHRRDDPVLTVQTSAGPVRGQSVSIRCSCGQVVARMDQRAKPLSCGARLYLETRAEVTVD